MGNACKSQNDLQRYYYAVLSKREVEEVLHCTEDLTSFLSSLLSLGQGFRCSHSCLEGRGLSSPGQPLGTYVGG